MKKESVIGLVNDSTDSSLFKFKFKFHFTSEFYIMLFYFVYVQSIVK